MCVLLKSLCLNITLYLYIYNVSIFNLLVNIIKNIFKYVYELKV